MKPAKASGAMNFFAKRPKTPAEVVKQVRDLLAPGGRLDGSVGNVDGRKKVSLTLNFYAVSYRQGAAGWLGV